MRANWHFINLKRYCIFCNCFCSVDFRSYWSVIVQANVSFLYPQTSMIDPVKHSFKNSFNPFKFDVTFLCLLKTSANLWFSDVFRGYRNETLIWNESSNCPQALEKCIDWGKYSECYSLQDYFFDISKLFFQYKVTWEIMDLNVFIYWYYYTSGNEVVTVFRTNNCICFKLDVQRICKIFF